MAVVWTGAVSNDWNNPNNWNPVGVPGTGVAITIPAGGTQPTVLDNTSATVGGATITNNGTMSLGSVGDTTQFIVNGAEQLSGGGKLVLSDFSANQIFSNLSGSVLENVNNTISGAGSITSNGGRLALTNDSGGTINATGTTNALSIHDIAVTNAGLLEATGTGGLLLSNATIANTGTIKALTGAQVTLSNTTVQGGTLTTVGTGVVKTAGTSTLDSTAATITLSTGSNLTIADNTALNLLGNLVNQGTVTLASIGDTTQLIANGTDKLSGGGKLVLSDFSANQIFSNLSGSVLENVNNTISGAGSITSNGGRLALTNDSGGTIAATGTNALSIHDIAVTNSGLLEDTGTGGLQLTTVSVDNTGNTNGGLIKAVGAGTHVDLNNTDIIGGTLTGSNGGFIQTTGAGSQLDGTGVGKPVTITAGTTLNLNDNTSLALDAATTGSLVNHGTLAVNSIGDTTDLLVGTGGTLALSGGGKIVLSDSGANRIYSNAGGSVLDNIDNTISGAGQIFSNGGRLSLINEASGVINATGANGLNVNNIVVTNKGLIEASGAGGLQLTSDTITNTNLIKALAGSHVDLNNTDIIGGTLTGVGTGLFQTTSAGTQLDGTGSGAPVTITAGTTLNVNDNTNLQLDAAAANGSLVNHGTIAVNSVGDTTDLLAGTGGTLALSGGGTIVLSDSSANRIYSNAGGSVLDNIDNTISGAGQIFSNGGRLLLINEASGVIDATGANGLNVNNIAVTNKGLIEATGAGGLQLTTDIITNKGTILVGAGSHADLNNTDIIGGTLTSVGTGLFQTTSTGTQLDGTGAGAPVTITAGTTLKIADNTSLTLDTTGGANSSIVNHGTIALASSGNTTDLLVGSVSGTVTLSGGGTLSLSDNPNNRVYSNASGSVLDNIDNKIVGAGQIFSNSGRLSLINEVGGVIDANGTNALSINTISFTNKGTVRAENGATLSLASALNNIAADPGTSGGATLAGGTYDIIDPATGGIGSGGSSTIAITGGAAAPITTLSATVNLTGATSMLTSAGTALSSSLLRVGLQGALNLGYGTNSGTQQVFNDSANPLEIAGKVSLTGAALSAQSILIDSAGVLTGTGIVAGTTAINAQVTGPITNKGTISAGGSAGSALIVNGTLANLAGGTVNLVGDVGLATNTGSFFNNAGGTLAKTSGSGTSVVSASFIDGTSAASKIVVNSGTLQFVGATDNFVAQTISGAGTFGIGAGTATIGTGTAITTAGFAVSGSGTQVKLGESLTYGGTYGQGGSAAVNLAGFNLVFKGSASILGAGGSGGYAGLSGGGAVTLSGTSALGNLIVGGATALSNTSTGTMTTSGQVLLGGTSSLTNSGTINQGGTVTVGDASGSLAKLVNLSGATYNLVGDVGIGVGSNPSAAFNNAGGTLAKTSGTGKSVISASVFDGTGAAGQIKIASGALQLNGPNNTLSAQTISGPGALLFGSNTYDLIGPGTTITAGAVSMIGTGGTLKLGENLGYAGSFSISNNSLLSLGSYTLTLSGPTSLVGAGTGNYAVISGSGTLNLSGTTTIGNLSILGSVQVVNTGAVTQTINVGIGDSNNQAATITNAAGATWTIASDGILAGTTASSFVNAGTLIKTGSTGYTQVTTNFVTSAASPNAITINSGTIQFKGATSAFVASTISGAGSFQILGGAATIGAGTSISTASFGLNGSGASVTLGESLSYGGKFSDSAATLNLGSNTLSLSGSAAFNGASVSGTGTLSLSGASTVSGLTVGGSATLQNGAGGVVTQSGTVTLGDGTNGAATLSDAGTWRISADVGIAAGGTASSLNVAGGTLTKTGGTGTSLIGVAVGNGGSTAGTIEAATGTLEFGGTVSGAENLLADANATMIFDKSVGAGSAFVYHGANATLQLNDAQDYHGTIGSFAAGETLDLRSILFGSTSSSPTYAGTASAGTLTVSDGTHTASLAFLGNYTTANFHAASDNHGGTLFTFA